MYLFIFLILYFLTVFFLRSYILWKKTKVNPLTFNKGDDAHGYNGKVFAFISVVEFIVVSIYAFVPSWNKFLMPFWYLESYTSTIIGWILLVISLILVSVAQSQMKESWRIGIDEKNKTELITSGLFSISRNPIFLSIMIANIGLFLALPNAFTLLIISISTISINTQIRLEEEFLTNEFGDKYNEYRNHVSRWLTF